MSMSQADEFRQSTKRLLVEDGPEGKGAQSDGTQFKQEAKRSACSPKIEEKKALTERSLCGGSASTKGTRPRVERVCGPLPE